MFIIYREKYSKLSTKRNTEEKREFECIQSKNTGSLHNYRYKKRK